MKSETIEVNGREITCYPDGSIEQFNKREQSLVRQMGNNSRGYLKVRIADKCFRVHRLVAQALLPDWDDSLQVDHINGLRDDNRVSNLRMVSNQQNSRACRRPTTGATSKFRGVSWDTLRGKWEARINVDGRSIYIGRFSGEIEAAIAYNGSAIIHSFLPEALNKV